MQAEKIVLFHLPFWTPMIPPMGISILKGHLEKKGYKVKTVDANVEDRYKIIYGEYFNTLKKYVPLENRGNFFSIGTDVFRNHLMAFINKENENDYFNLIKETIANIYFIAPSHALLIELDEVVGKFYLWLSGFISKHIEEQSPGFVGISVFRDTLAASLFTFRLIKKINPDIVTFMGGPIFSEQLRTDSPDFDFFLDKTKDIIDKVFVNYSIKLLSDFLDNKLETSQRVFESDLEERTHFFEPDFSDFGMEKYPFIGLEGSTGCYYECTFCNVIKYFGRFKERDSEAIVNVMERLLKLYNNQMFFMCDNLVNPYMSKLSEKIIEQKLPVYWSAYARIHADQNNYDKVMLWREGGLYQVRIGIDSGSQRMIDVMNKKFSLEQSKYALMNLAKAGIKVTAYFVVGHPGETEADFQGTLDYLSEMKDYIWEAECEYYNYYYSGQGGSDAYSEKRKLLYDSKYKNMLYIDKWIIDGEPSWEEIFSRDRRFVDHCTKLGIPNVYTLNEIAGADIRWKKLQKNAVPPLLDFLPRKEIIVEDFRSGKIRNNLNVRAKIEDFDF